MRTAMNVAKNKNAILNTGAGAKDAVTEPIATPMIAGQRTDADYLGDHRTLLFMSEIGTHRRGHDDR